MSNNHGSQHIPLPIRRMGQMEPMYYNPGSQKVMIRNQTMFKNQGLQSVPYKFTTVQMESMPNEKGSQQLAITTNQISQMESSPKAQTEIFESVRSKLRESLTSSLALVCHQQNKLPTIGKSPQSEDINTLREANKDPQPAESTSTTVDVSSCQVPERPLDILPSKVENTEGALKTFTCGQEFQMKHVLPEEDGLLTNCFLVKDELLQGNGLFGASELDVEVAESEENIPVKRPKLVHNEGGGDGGETGLQSPQTLAIKIEAELFNLFGGVNKKYKEKGRSLLFNLKDHNNPELRERVLCGEISPKRLCSMSAEDLASKELTQWRIAKAEALQQMVVLPDSEVDIRRLVKKTHKGEFQVEVEQYDSVSEEVSVGASSLSQFCSRVNETESKTLSKPNEPEKSEVGDTRENSTTFEGQDLPSNLTTLPHDGTDLTQGILVDGEFKDAEFLSPIVSLDEFMESLDAEPPFQNLPVNAGQATPNSVGPVDTVPSKPIKMGMKYTRANSNMKSSEIHVESEANPRDGASKGEHVWEGLLQLNISAMVNVIGFFKSGEKTSTKEWPSFLEIKGRVRLDAFEKFLQELPMSRTRAIMVVLFCWKEGTPESGLANLCEVADSYIVDERVGFAEPAPGVELYLCPSHTKTTEILGKTLPKDHTETLNAKENGLIGIVVWRKPHIISPKKSSSQHKHPSKKQHHTKRKHQEKGINANSNAILPSKLFDEEEPIDDIPPGFGPSADRDDDDLPEFDFISGTNPPSKGLVTTPFHSSAQPPAPPPVAQMRELINKYGHNKNGVNSGKWGIGIRVQPWNDDDDDDDDDIPEWHPEPPQHQPPPPLPIPLQPLQRPQSGWWAPPSASHVQGNGMIQPCHFRGQPIEGQFYMGPSQNGMNLRRDVPRNRGF